MCGIVGFVSSSEFLNDLVIKRMLGEIAHRGPDDEGIFKNRKVVLGVRRLAIIDVKRGKQPIKDESKNIICVFNGEIYNYRELRKDLQKRGHIFKSKADTEVIVHLYEEKAEGLFHYLNGMFAIAIWDENNKKLILARDRLGQKPLYYGQFKKNFIFGSEIKAILAHPNVKKELDLNSLQRYLTFEYVPAPYSIFKNIYKLEPGHLLVYKNGRIFTEKYWDVGFKRLRYSSEEEATFKLEKLIEDSVKMRLVSDVPLGVFLSGGLDSSVISYYASKNSKRKLNSFSIGFEEESFDESRYAKKVASFLGLRHHHKYFKQKDLAGLIPEVVDKMDEPLADASLFPTFLLSRFARKKVTVALGGDGGDELFMGYPTFQAHKIAEIYKYVPRLLHKNLISSLVESLPVSAKNFSFDFKAKKFIEGAQESVLARNQIWLSAFTSKENLKKIILGKTIKMSGLIDPINESVENLESLNLSKWDLLTKQYLNTYLADDILAKVDRASMFNSLEARSPFLDYRLVEFACSLPLNLKLKGLTTKYILKKLMYGKLPSAISERPKKGFGIPVSIWLKSFMRNQLLETLSYKKIRRQQIFNPNEVKNLIDNHLAGKRDNRKQLWTLMMFELWYANYLNG